MLAAPKASRCEHPTSRTNSVNNRHLEGSCKTAAMGTYDIPPDYAPDTRPKLPSPAPSRMRLCPAHKAMVDAFIAGSGSADPHTHEGQCRVCRHPDHKRIERLWLEWVYDTGEVLAALSGIPGLSVSHSSWHRHCQHFGLLDKKAAKVNTKRALVIAAERGFGAGGHSVRTALIALQQLSKERGDVEEVKHTVTGIIGTVDLTKLTSKELAVMANKLARELQTESVGAGIDAGAGSEQAALPSGMHQTIDLPASAVKVRAGKGRGKD